VGGLVRGFLGGWGGGEPGLLVFDELRGFFADVANGFESKFAREVVGCVFRRLLDVGGPAFGGVEEFGQSFADIAVTGAVVVEVVVEFVGDGGELLEEVVGVLLASGFARMSEEVLDGFGADVEEFDKDENAIVGVVGGCAELFDLAFGESAVVGLSVKGQSKSKEEKDEGDPAEHRFLVFHDFGEEFFVDLIELLEGGLEGVLVFAGSFVEILAEPVGGVVEEHLGVLEAFAVVGHIHVNQLGVVIDLLEGGTGLVDVAVEHLAAGDLGHGIDELCIEEALVARTSLLGALLQLGEGLGVEKIVRVAGGVRRHAEGKGQR